MAQYRLLRNNKESGPFTQEQLIQMGLKAYDLVWMEGKSAAWRYPSEINELKAYAPAVEENPFDRFYKRKDNKTVPAEQVTATAETVAVKKEKPRFRVKADVRKIDVPVAVYESSVSTISEPQTYRAEAVQNTAVMEAPKPAATAPPWEAIYSEWKVKTAAKPTPVTSNNALPLQSEAVVETKFTQSLNDIKERYVETILKPREVKKTPLNKRYVLLAVLLPLLGFGMWLSYTLKEPSEGNEKVVQPPTNTVKQETETPSLINNADNDKDASSDAANTAGEEAVQRTGDNKTDEAIINKSTDNNLLQQQTKPDVTNAPDTKVITDDKKTVAEYSPAEQTKNNEALSKTPAVKYNNTAMNLPAATANSTSPDDYTPLDKEIIKNTDNAAAPASPARLTRKKIEDYVVVNNTYKPRGSSIENLRLSVENITDFPIDLAVLDVQYFDANGRYQKGETVYVKDIPANKNVLVKVPDSNNSYSVNYKVSLISAEQSTLYLIAD